MSTFKLRTAPFLGTSVVIVLATGVALAAKLAWAEDSAIPSTERLNSFDPGAFVGLFKPQLPIDPGPIPSGLPNLSAQGCNACHFDAHDSWRESAHHGSGSNSFRIAAAAAGTPWCSQCHRPLISQHADITAYPDGNPNHPRSRPNNEFDPTLAGEGVTCASCHVREGKVLTGRVQSVNHPAPHPLAFSPELGSAEGCAACHQLAWPGANSPLYDTYGEWQRSPQAKAGVECIDCHFSSGAATGPASHSLRADPARAVSLLVRIDSPKAQRGGEPLRLRLVLQNTGAGHRFPTGSPWRGVRLAAELIGPVSAAKGKAGMPARVGAGFVHDFARTIESGPPWNTLGDTRLGPGETAEFDWSPTIPAQAVVPPGPSAWSVRVTLTETQSGKPADTSFVTQVIPLDID